MGVKMTKSSVAASLDKAKPAYDEAWDFLKSAYKKMRNLHSYWGGDLYNEIVLGWNAQELDLIKFMDATKEVYNATSGALWAYTDADKPGHGINKGTVEMHNLGEMIKSNSDKLTAESSTIRSDKISITTDLAHAKSRILTIYTLLKSIDASSPKIDALKDTIGLIGNKVLENLQAIIDVITKNMETAASNLDAGENAIADV